MPQQYDWSSKVHFIYTPQYHRLQFCLMGRKTLCQNILKQLTGKKSKKDVRNSNRGGILLPGGQTRKRCYVMLLSSKIAKSLYRKSCWQNYREIKTYWENMEPGGHPAISRWHQNWKDLIHTTFSPPWRPGRRTNYTNTPEAKLEHIIHIVMCSCTVLCAWERDAMHLLSTENKWINNIVREDEASNWTERNNSNQQRDS